MPTEEYAHPPQPERLVSFIELQVTDALLNSDIFPDETPESASSVLFALAVLSCIPPVPNNRKILDDTFAYMQTHFSSMVPSEQVYNSIVIDYNRYLGVFQKSAALPKKAPMGNPYEEVSKAAAYQLGFPSDGAKIFHLTLWMTHYCKDAIALFFSSFEEASVPSRHMPTAIEAYAFISKHVNNTISDPTFFTDGAPGNATEVFTALYTVVAVLMQTHDKSLVYAAMDYMHGLLTKNGYSPLFFERIMQALERLMTLYRRQLAAGTKETSNVLFEALAEEAVRMMGLYPDTLLTFNITAYFPALINDAMANLYPVVSRGDNFNREKHKS